MNELNCSVTLDSVENKITVNGLRDSALNINTSGDVDFTADSQISCYFSRIFHTELHRVFLKWIMLRELHRDRSFGRFTC